MACHGSVRPTAGDRLLLHPPHTQQVPVKHQLHKSKTAAVKVLDLRKSRRRKASARVESLTNEVGATST